MMLGFVNVRRFALALANYDPLPSEHRDPTGTQQGERENAVLIAITTGGGIHTD